MILDTSLVTLMYLLDLDPWMILDTGLVTLLYLIVLDP